jgi:hypothetical protein
MDIKQKTKRFMTAQINAIDLAKYLEGCNKDYDPGEAFIIAWITTHAESFSDNWWSCN